MAATGPRTHQPQQPPASLGLALRGRAELAARLLKTPSHADATGASRVFVGNSWGRSPTLADSRVTLIARAGPEHSNQAGHPAELGSREFRRGCGPNTASCSVTR